MGPWAKSPAPPPITPAQAQLEQLEGKAEELSARMYEEGQDAASVEKLWKDKEDLDERIAKLYAEVTMRGPV